MFSLQKLTMTINNNGIFVERLDGLFTVEWHISYCKSNGNDLVYYKAFNKFNHLQF